MLWVLHPIQSWPLHHQTAILVLSLNLVLDDQLGLRRFHCVGCILGMFTVKNVPGVPFQLPYLPSAGDEQNFKEFNPEMIGMIMTSSWRTVGEIQSGK